MYDAAVVHNHLTLFYRSIPKDISHAKSLLALEDHSLTDYNKASFPYTTLYTIILETIINDLHNILLANDIWDSTKHISTIGYITYIKIKAHQFFPLRLSNASLPALFFVLAHTNHWADKIADLSDSVASSHWFTFNTSNIVFNHYYTPIPINCTAVYNSLTLMYPYSSIMYIDTNL